MKFSDVLGNKNAINQIRQLVDSDRMPHALLLYGEPGIPKLALALATAQYIHCTNRTHGDSCGHCPSCLQHQTFNHADTFFSFPIVKRTSTDKPVSDNYIAEWKQFITDDPIVEDYQRWLTLLKNENAQPVIYASESDSILEKMTLTAFSSSYKVLIMWLPEKMNESCANKLLKIIEEPPADSRFILVSDNAKAILPTIFSRTQRIELKRPSTGEIASYLASAFNVDAQQATATAAAANGNVALAKRLMQLGNENHEFHLKFMELMRMAYAHNLEKLRDWSLDIVEYKREKTIRFLNYAAMQVRENFIKNLGMPQLNYMTSEEQAFSARFAPFINEKNVEGLATQIDRAIADIRQNANARIVLFDFAIRISILMNRK